MLEYLILYIKSLISEYGAWGVFLATLIEEIIAPIPSPIVPLSAGFFLITATGTSLIEAMWSGLFVIALPVTIGISIGSSLIYSLGFFGGKPIIEKSKRWTGINWQDIEKTEARLTRGKGDEITLFTLRVLPIMPGVAISCFCGIVQYPFRKFIIITCLGSFVRAFILGIIGWQVGELYVTYASVLAEVENYIFAGFVFLIILCFVVYIVRKFKKTH